MIGPSFSCGPYSVAGSSLSEPSGLINAPFGNFLPPRAATSTLPSATIEVARSSTTGAAPAIDRAEGFASAIGADDTVEVVASQTGDFTRDGGKKVMETFLNSEDGIDVVFAHNDDMGLGAIEAIEAAGLTPGKDVKIITVDAVKDGMAALAEGKINFIVECNPLLGDYAADLVKKVVNGDSVEKQNFAKDGSFTQEQAAAVIDSRPY